MSKSEADSISNMPSEQDTGIITKNKESESRENEGDITLSNAADGASNKTKATEGNETNSTENSESTASSQNGINSSPNDSVSQNNKRKYTDENDSQCVLKNKKVKIADGASPNKSKNNGARDGNSDNEDSDNSLAIDDPEMEIDDKDEEKDEPQVLKPTVSDNNSNNHEKTAQLTPNTSNKTANISSVPSKNVLINKDGSQKENNLSAKEKTVNENGKTRFEEDELDMECTTEDLSDIQKARFTMMSNDYEQVEDILKSYMALPKKAKNSRPRYKPKSPPPPPPKIRPSVTAPSPTPIDSPSTPTLGAKRTLGIRTSPTPPPSQRSTALLPKRSVPPCNYREDSPEIEVVSEKRISAPTNSSFSSPRPEPQAVKKPATPSINHTALLNILARPSNMHPVAIAVKDRKELDVMVKSSLVKPQQDFAEWLFALRLLKDRLICQKHRNPPAIRLGHFETPSALPSSGGYVWMVECCPGGRKYVSIYSGSIFAIGLKEGISATSVLKLIYHWSCQTTISNVENWVKVSRDVIGRTYHYLRCVCSVILQDKLYDMGAKGTTIELGIVSLGTTTADGTKKAVKVEILGLYDRDTCAYRLYASAPQNNVSSAQRFMKILKPVLSVVHHNAEIVCDYSIDRTCLPCMNYKKVIFCSQNQEGTKENSNSKIMTYLRKHVPKMFQNSLSQLTLEQVQLVLDELCWRESFGRSPFHSYTNIMKHLAYLTTREIEYNGLLSFLDFIALNPHKSWRYVPDPSLPSIVIPPCTPPTMHPASHPLPPTLPIIKTGTPLVHPGIDVDASTRNRNTPQHLPIDVDPVNIINPLLHENKMVLSIINNEVHPIRNASKHKNTTNSIAANKSPVTSNMANASGMSSSSSKVNISHLMRPPAQLVSRPPAPKPITPRPPAPRPPAPKVESVELVPFFYGEIPGDESVGKEMNYAELKCFKCHEVCEDNISFYTHMKSHLFEQPLLNMKICKYCILQFPDEESLSTHVKEVHDPEGREGDLCRICLVTFSNENFLISHMCKMHVEAELPYRCEVCNYASSYYTKVIDHFIECHRGAPYIQCHYCLNVKLISPVNQYSMSNWILTHLMEHSKGVRCNYCVLSLRNKSKKSISSHMVSHVSFRERKDLVRYSCSKKIVIHKGVSVTIGRRNSAIIANPITTLKPAVAMSRLIEPTPNLSVETDSNCTECGTSMNKENHYISYQRCTQCQYATCCSFMMPHHTYVFHPYQKSKKVPFSIGPPIVFDEPIVCNCGFSSLSGNHIARHMSKCSESNGTAYPALPDEPQDTLLNPENIKLLLSQPPAQLNHFLNFEEDEDGRNSAGDNDVSNILMPNVELKEM